MFVVQVVSSLLDSVEKLKLLVPGGTYDSLMVVIIGASAIQSCCNNLEVSYSNKRILPTYF